MYGLDKTIGENLNGKYIIIYIEHFYEGIEYAYETKIPQIQIRSMIGAENSEMKVDFRVLEKLSNTLNIISISGKMKDTSNFDSIYSLASLRKMYIEDKQSFSIDVSRFPKLEHLGADYWKGLVNIEKARSLRSVVILKLPDINLQRFSSLKKLDTLHVYSSKIQSLDGIEGLPIKNLSLARNYCLEDIKALKELKKLEVVNFEKCRKITDYKFVEELRNGIKVGIFK
jgi:internalin A